MATSRIEFDVRRGGDLVRVIIEDGFATIRIAMIDDVRPVLEAMNRAVAAGATRGALFTGEVVHEHTAAMHLMRVRQGLTWLGGRVSLLAMRANGPEFRIDFDKLPTITE